VCVSQVSCASSHSQNSEKDSTLPTPKVKPVSGQCKPKDRDDIIKFGSDKLFSVEVNLGVICACVPALRGLLVKKMPSSILSKIKRSQASNTSDSEGPQAHNVDNKTGNTVNINRISRIDDDEEAARRHRLSTRIGSGFDIPLNTFQHLP